MTDVVINTSRSGLTSLTAISASLNYDPCKVMRHDHRLVALVLFLQATTNDCTTELDVVEVPHGHKYRIDLNGAGAECVVHENSLAFDNWIDPAFDWDASPLVKPDVVKVDLPGVTSPDQAGRIAGRFQTDHLSPKTALLRRGLDTESEPTNEELLDGALTCISRGLAFRGMVEPVDIAIHVKGLLTLGEDPVHTLNEMAKETQTQIDNKIMRAALFAIEKLTIPNRNNGPYLAREALAKVDK